MRGPRLLVAAAASVAVAGTVLAVPAHAAACEQGSGVTVVVDFASLGGGVQTDCAPGDPGSGIEALRGSGHEPTRAAQQAGYFVCRIDGLPADDPCQRASPENAYWSYWHAQPGGSWTYSNTGPADRDPNPGTVEGWAFGAGDPPSIAPPRERQSAPAPKPSPDRSPTRTPSAPSPAPAASAGSPAAVAPTAAAEPSESASAAVTPSPSASASATSSPSSSSSPSASPSLTPGAVVVDRVPDEGGAGSLAGPLAALGVVLLLAAGGAYQVQQRRSRDAAI